MAPRRLLLGGLGAIVAISVVAGCSAAPSDTAPPTAGDRALLTARLLEQQSAAVTAHRRAGYLAGWADQPSSRRLAVRSYDNLDRLEVATFRARLVSGAVLGREPTWSAAVDVTWGVPGWPGSVTSRLHYTFVEQAGRAQVSSITPLPGTHQPVWLLAALEVRRGPRFVVAGIGHDQVGRVAAQLRRAVTAVDGVLPRWQGDLTAYVPATSAQFDALVAARPGDYRGIAAVTSTVDGSPDRAEQEVIVVNPGVFAGLGPVGSQVVVTHEAVHAATRAAASTMPLWVAEGFADYVAIGASQVPLQVAVHAAVQQVRRHGAPASLPGAAAFDIGGAALEATYEEAWVATSLIASTYGRPRLVAFYRFMQAHPDDEAGAFRTVLHTGEAAFTAQWQARLRGLATG